MKMKDHLIFFKRAGAFRFGDCGKILSWFQFETQLLVVLLLFSFLSIPVNVNASAKLICKDSVKSIVTASDFLAHIESKKQLIKMDKKYEHEKREGYPATSADLRRAVVQVKNGRLYSPTTKKYVDTGSYQPDSSISEFLHHRTDFVITKDGKILLMQYLEEIFGFRLFHSDLSLGKDIIAAGTMAVADGVIIEITNHSGHYPSGMAPLNRGVRYLKLLGLKIPKERIFDYTDVLR
jgi:hypothetical protein